MTLAGQLLDRAMGLAMAQNEHGSRTGTRAAIQKQ
jgi:hypothetical protein